MEDAHIAMLKVPHGKPPTSAAIGAARIGLFSSQNNKPPLGNSSRGTNSYANGGGGPSSAAGAAGADAGPRRGRAGTFSAGDTGDSFPQQQQQQQGRAREEALATRQTAVPRDAARRASTGTEDERKRALAAAASGDGESSAGAGWKAVDLLEDAALFGVFDGHGGKAVADFCKERLPGWCTPYSRASRKRGPCPFRIFRGVVHAGRGLLPCYPRPTCVSKLVS